MGHHAVQLGRHAVMPLCRFDAFKLRLTSDSHAVELSSRLTAMTLSFGGPTFLAAVAAIVGRALAWLSRFGIAINTCIRSAAAAKASM